jgi:hypothetical protein
VRLAAFGLAIAAGGCGAVFGIPSDVELASSTPDAAIADAGLADTAPPADDGDTTPANPDTGAPPPVTCNPKGEFGEPVQLHELDTQGGSFDARLSDDELTVFFSGKEGEDLSFDLYTSNRRDKAMPFGPRLHLDLSSSPGDEQSPNVSSDGLTILYRSSSSTQNYQIAKRPSFDKAFAPAGSVLVLWPGNQVRGTFFIRASRPTELWLDAAQPGQSESADIFTGDWEGDLVKTPLAPPNINVSTRDDESPVISEDGLTLYFARHRDEIQERRFFDVFTAKRPTVASAFGSPQVVPALVGSSTTDTVPTWISPDNCHLYLWRSSDDAPRSVWMSTRR